MLTDDYNRVVLETIGGRTDSDYVNASYVDVSIWYFLDKKKLMQKLLERINRWELFLDFFSEFTKT